MKIDFIFAGQEEEEEESDHHLLTSFKFDFQIAAVLFGCLGATVTG